MTHQNEVRPPLSKLRVLDLADEKASYCSKILAALGANVIKIERPDGDISRYLGNSINNKDKTGNNVFFLFNNTDKLSITLNLETKKGRYLFRKLVITSDIVITTLSKKFLNRKHINYQHLNKINPRLIMVSVNNCVQKDIEHSCESCDIIASATGGQMYVTGKSDSYPLKTYSKQTYYIASLYAIIGIFIAIIDRHRSNQGQFIDISIQETTASTLEPIIIRWFNEGNISKRSGSIDLGNLAGIFPCKDGHIFLSFEREWDTLIEWLKSEKCEDDLDNKKWQDINYRRKRYLHIIKVIKKWTKKHYINELFEPAQMMRFPWAPVQNIPQLFTNPQLSSRRFFTLVRHKNLGKSFIYPDIPSGSLPFKKTQTRQAPLLGEHNLKIYHNELGLSLKQISQLKSKGII